MSNGDKSDDKIDGFSRRDTLKMAAATAAGASAMSAPIAGAQARETAGKATKTRLPFGQGETWISHVVSWYEFPTNDTDRLEIWGYTDRPSYAPGDEVALHVNTTASEYAIEIFRDGGIWQSVFKKEGIPGKYHPTPIDNHEQGCGWPADERIRIPSAWKSGGYVVVLSAKKGDERAEQEAFFLLRSAQPGQDSKILFMPAVPTWLAYNDWGGGSHYRLSQELGGGGREGRETSFATHYSIHRPWARGFIRRPSGAPSAAQKPRHAWDRPIGWRPQYPAIDWAFANGYSLFSSFAGWASYDSHFVRWAERSGYVIDYANPHDIYEMPDLLDNYNVVVQVGHDEYHSRAYRDALERHLARGGRIARMGGNLLWQVRLEGSTQVSHKTLEALDPLARDLAKKREATGGWEQPKWLNYPPVTTRGVNGHNGVYAVTGAATPRGPGGFTVYRNKHWVFEGTDLYYGDLLGGDVPIVDFEIDGAERTARFLYGNAAMTYMRKGKGEVFAAGACDWVRGLEQKDPFVERIMRNVLDRFAK